MEESPSLRHEPSEPEPGEAAAAAGLLRRPHEVLNTRDIALKVAVASIATVALSHLGPIAALGGIAVSLMVESGIERLVRRLGKKTLWGTSVLFLLLAKIDRLLSAIGLRGRAGVTTAAATAACAAVAGAMVVGAFTVPEVAIGHSITASRDLTFFNNRHDVPPKKSGVLSVSVTKSTPKFMLPRSVKAKAVPMTGAIVRYHASMSRGNVVCTPASGTFFRIGRHTVRCAARVNGRVTRRSFTVVVADTSPPRLGLPRSITSQAGSADGVAVTYVATSSDDLSGKSVAHCTPQSGSTFPVGSTTVDCTATDGGGNTTSGSFTVTVTQTESNQLALPPPVTVEATSDEGAVVRYPGSAGSSAVSCTPQSGSQLPLGVTTVSCRSGGASGTFQVSIVDTTPPQVSVPTDVSATATSPRGAAVSYAVAARDSVDGTIVPSCTPQSGATFAIGQTLVRCTISDSHGNERQRSFAVKVVDGPPKLDLPTTATAAAVNARGAQLTLDFTAKDAVDGRVDVQCGQPNQTFPIGRTTVICTAKDSAGNTARGSLVVIVRDEAAPRITLPSGAVTANATGPKGGVATWNVSAADNVDGAVPVSCDRTSGDIFAIGDTQVACSARDRAGNLASGSFTVAVRDRAAPHLTVPTNTVVAAADDRHGARVSFSVTATDAVDGTIPASCDPQPGSLFPLGQTTVSCTAQDAAGNAAQPASFTVAVRDLTPPRFDLPNSPFTAPTIDANGGPVQFTATAYDAVDGTLAAQCNPSSGETFPYGRTTVTCTATDNAGNKGTDSFVVRLVDTEAPTLYLPASPVLGCTCDWPYTGGYISWSASGADNVDGSVDVTCTPASGSYFLLGDTIVSCSATDSSGNTTIGTFVVTIEPD